LGTSTRCFFMESVLPSPARRQMVWSIYFNLSLMMVRAI
jgi:hypothetical protein